MIVKPLIVLGAPRSGTTILQCCLALHPHLWHLRNESHAILEGPFHPSRNGYESNRVLSDDIGEDLVQRLRKEFYRRAINLNEAFTNPSPLLGRNVGIGEFGWIFHRIAISGAGMVSRLKKPDVLRFLEKTPKNTLRVPLLNRIFPDAFYIWIKRRAANNIDSLVAGWHLVDANIIPFMRPRFARAGYPVADQLGLLDYSGKWWKFALVPGWRDLKEKTVADVAAWQYYQCNYYTLIDLESLSDSQVFSVRYEDFVQRPVEILRQIFEYADLPPSEIAEGFAEVLPRINDPTPRSHRSLHRLRYPDTVLPAIDRLPAIGALQRMMGYDD